MLHLTWSGTGCPISRCHDNQDFHEFSPMSVKDARDNGVLAAMHSSWGRLLHARWHHLIEGEAYWTRFLAEHGNSGMVWHRLCSNPSHVSAALVRNIYVSRDTRIHQATVESYLIINHGIITKRSSATPPSPSSRNHRRRRR